MTRRILFYVQHLLGIGHLARASLICQGLVDEGFEVKMVMGGVPVEGFPAENIDVEYLPILKAGCFQFNDLTDDSGKLVDEQYLNNRRDKLLRIFNQFQPDILVIEAFPFGRRQMRFELLPLLEAARAAHWSPLIAGSVRDIVQEKKKPKRLRETVETLREYFDLLLVHGDPQFARLEETFELAREIDYLIYYTGIVSADIPPLTGDQYDVVVSAGGGAAGELIMLNALQARPLTCLADKKWCFVTGPNLSPETRKVLEQEKSEKLAVETHRTDFRALLARAHLSVSQAGYNTMADILRAKCRCVLVPFSSGGETEQSHRAVKLSERGLAMSISEEGLTPAALAKLIDQAVSRPPVEPDGTYPALNGAAETAQILRRAIQSRQTRT